MTVNPLKIRRFFFFRLFSALACRAPSRRCFHSGTFLFTSREATDHLTRSILVSVPMAKPLWTVLEYRSCPPARRDVHNNLAWV